MRVPTGDAITLVDRALTEDVGAGDWTTLWTVPEGRTVQAAVVAKAAGTVAGLDVARAAFHRVDASLAVSLRVADGDRVRPAQEILFVEGSARSILTAERVMLNFLQRLSGVATLARAFVDAVAGTGVTILDTRKTTPGLRALEKEAVRAGGASNHRFGLHDMVLIKENHIRAAGGIEPALRAVATENRAGLAVEIETTSLNEVREVLRVGADRILLDNMAIETLRAAVGLVRADGRGIETEASGGVTLATVREIAGTGIDFISVGALTHSPPALDLSLLVSIDD
jgi:nicotinate-nucleotide pyrophosphorylase (carboxylating)